MSDKAVATQSEQPVAKQGKRKSCMRHCLKFWWAYLIGFICIVVLVVCLIIFVGVPKIAQKKLDESELQVDGIHVTQTRADSYNMAINSTIRSSGGVSARIREFEADMYLEDLEPHTPFVKLHFPETSSTSLQTVNTSKAIEIENMDAFSTFNTWLLANETVRVTIKGDTAVRVSGISRWFSVTYKKTMELKGLNHFKGLAVTETELSLAPDSNGDNFRGFVDIPNPSVLTIEIGNASFWTYLEGERVGITRIDNLTLFPGINNSSLRANITRQPVVDAASTRPGCVDGIVDFVLGGREVENHGEVLPYFTRSLSLANLTVPIDIGTAFENLLGERPACRNSTSDD